MKISFGKLFGYEKVVSANTPEICFKNLYKRAKNGELEALLYIAQISMITPQMLEETSGLVKGYLQRYLIHVLEKMNLRVAHIQDEGNKAQVQVTGVTTDLKELIELFSKKIKEFEPELGLQTGEKINMRKVGLMLDFLEECIQSCGTVAIEETLYLNKGDLQWEVQQTPSLTRAFLGMETAVLEQTMHNSFGYLLQQEK